MARRPSVFTLYTGSASRLLRARTRGQLHTELRRYLPWSESDCRELARLLFDGVAVSAPDFDVLIFPGNVTMWCGRPEECVGSLL